ncbi:hypothetical protein U1Q18_002374, partial [Sarracenia purpurea var. burkii]
MIQSKNNSTSNQTKKQNRPEKETQDAVISTNQRGTNKVSSISNNGARPPSAGVAVTSIEQWGRGAAFGGDGFY